MQTSQASVNYVNNVVTGRAPNTYSPYDSHGNVYSYYNSSYDTGKIPTPDAPRIEDVDAASVYYCEKGKEKQGGRNYLVAAPTLYPSTFNLKPLLPHDAEKRAALAFRAARSMRFACPFALLTNHQLATGSLST